MTEGRIMSTGGDTPIIDTHQSVHKMVFDDLMRISEDAMRMGLYATGIQFFVASILSHKEKKCEFKTSNNDCRSYTFNSVQTRHILKHNYALLNNSGADFDSAAYFPYRIREGKLDLFHLKLLYYLYRLKAQRKLQYYLFIVKQILLAVYIEMLVDKDKAMALINTDHGKAKR